MCLLNWNCLSQALIKWLTIEMYCYLGWYSSTKIDAAITLFIIPSREQERGRDMHFQFDYPSKTILVTAIDLTLLVILRRKEEWDSESSGIVICISRYRSFKCVILPKPPRPTKVLYMYSIGSYFASSNGSSRISYGFLLVYHWLIIIGFLIPGCNYIFINEF